MARRYTRYNVGLLQTEKRLAHMKLRGSLTEMLDVFWSVRKKQARKYINNCILKLRWIYYSDYFTQFVYNKLMFY